MASIDVADPPAILCWTLTVISEEVGPIGECCRVCEPEQTAKLIITGYRPDSPPVEAVLFDL